MAPKIAEIKQHSKMPIPIQFIAMWVIVMIIIAIFKTNFILTLSIAFLFYLAWLYLPIRFVCPDLIKADKTMRKQNYADAIPLYQKSYDFFTQHPALDEHKAFLFINYSTISYKELCLLNIANCYVQLGQKEKGKEVYQDILQKYPDNYIAKNTIKFLQ